MRTAALLLLFVSVGAVARDEPKDEKSKDPAALKGNWQIVSAESEGMPNPSLSRPGTFIVIEGDKLHFKNWLTQSQPTTFKLDTKAKPRAINLGEDKREGMGIYELDGDSLKLCLSLNGVRPKEFKTAAGDKTSLLVLKRKKP